MTVNDYKMPAAHCVNCGEVCDAAMAPDAEKKPVAGDYSMCITCGTLMVFTESMGLRWPTGAELDTIAGDKNLVRMSKALADLHREMRENPLKYGIK